MALGFVVAGVFCAGSASGLVSNPVVVPAQRGRVVGVGDPAVYPRCDVIKVTVHGRHTTTGVDAYRIHRLDYALLRCGRPAADYPAIDWSTGVGIPQRPGPPCVDLSVGDLRAMFATTVPYPASYPGSSLTPERDSTVAVTCAPPTPPAMLPSTTSNSTSLHSRSMPVLLRLTMSSGRVLPDGSELRPTVQITDAESDVGGYVFDPPLPEGSVIYLNGSALVTVGPRGQ